MNLLFAALINLLHIAPGIAFVNNNPLKQYPTKQHEISRPSPLTQLQQHERDHVPPPTELFSSALALPDTSNPHSILNLDNSVTDMKEIKKAYRRMVVQYHPDTITNSASTDQERHRANEEFARINTAYAILTGKSPDPGLETTGKKRESRSPGYSFYTGKPFTKTPVGTLGFSKGDRVKITSGAHARRYGVVETIYPEKKLVRVIYNNAMSIFVESRYVRLRDFKDKEEFIYTSGEVYRGGWQMGEPHGEGRMVFPSGAVYEGQYAYGKQHGMGNSTFSNGDYYTGEWRSDNPSGRGEGRFTADNGDCYEGEYLDGKMHGAGRCYSENNEVYEGEWKNGREDGGGGCMFANGDVYEGEWKEGSIHGSGIYKSEIGDVYNGEWVKGWECGQGSCTFASGDVYQGEWKTGKENGFGLCNFANGDVYNGKWATSKLHGEGKYTYANGDVYEGMWFYGKRDGQGMYFFTNGDTYQGGWIKNLKSGDGIYTFADGDVVLGIWKEDEFREDESRD